MLEDAQIRSRIEEESLPKLSSRSEKVLKREIPATVKARQECVGGARKVVDIFVDMIANVDTFLSSIVSVAIRHVVVVVVVVGHVAVVV